MNLTKNVKVTLVAAGGSSAGTAVNSTGVDMAGFEGVVFIGTIATVNAGNFANAAQGSDNSNFTDLAGSKVVPGTNGNAFMIDINKPSARYVRCELDRSGTNTAYGDIYAIQYGAKVAPTTHGTTIDAELHVSPVTGTA
jgi:hypothetical protein